MGGSNFKKLEQVTRKFGLKSYSQWGIAQCAAQMYAAHQFNLQREVDSPVLYGCATDGTEWHFLKYEQNVFYIDKRPVTDLAQILGTWHWIFRFFLDNYGKK